MSVPGRLAIFLTSLPLTMTSSRVQMRKSSRSSETSSTAVPPSRASAITLSSDSLAATSTPTVGETATNTAGLPGQRSPNHYLLLVAAAQLPDRLIEATGNNAQLVHQICGNAVAGGARNDSPTREIGQEWMRSGSRLPQDREQIRAHAGLLAHTSRHGAGLRRLCPSGWVCHPA